MREDGSGKNRNFTHCRSDASWVVLEATVSVASLSTIGDDCMQGESIEGEEDEACASSTFIRLFELAESLSRLTSFCKTSHSFPEEMVGRDVSLLFGGIATLRVTCMYDVVRA